MYVLPEVEDEWLSFDIHRLLSANFNAMNVELVNRFANNWFEFGPASDLILVLLNTVKLERSICIVTLETDGSTSGST